MRSATKVKKDVIDSKHTYSFNLVTEPWIRVLKDDGSNPLLSLNDLFNQANDIIDLSNENVYTDTSIVFILYAIIYKSYSRNETLKKSILSSGKFVYDKDTILQYLSDNKDSFDIYDKMQPFLQVTPETVTPTVWFDKKKGKIRETTVNECLRDSGEKPPLNYLNIFSPSKNKTSQWCTSQNLIDDVIARNLITFRLYHPAMNPSPCVHSGLLAPFNCSFSLLFMTGRTLCDLFELNFIPDSLKEEQTPIWEINPEKDAAIVKSHITEIGDKVYFDIFRATGGISYFLTYSNVNIYIDREKGIFRVGYRVPAMLFKTEENIEGKSINVIHHCLNDRLNVISTYKRNYSIAKNILDIDVGRFVNARSVRVVIPPEYGDKNTFFKRMFTKPISVIGNGALRAISDDVTVTEDLRRRLQSTCEELEKIEKNYVYRYKRISDLLSKVLGKSIIRKDKRKNFQETIYDSLMGDAVSLVENDFFDLSVQYLEYLDNDTLDEDVINKFLEKESKHIISRATKHFQDSYRSFIRNYCNDVYFALDKSTKDTDKECEDINMSKYADLQKAARNFNYYVKHCCKDLVSLRKMRQENYNLELIDEPYCIVADKNAQNRHDINITLGIKKALYLWANHEHDLQEDKHATVIHTDAREDYVSYKETFGYVLYLKSLSMSSDDWKTEMHKYEIASRSLDALIRYMRLTIKEVSRSYSLQLDYARFAYYFSRIIDDVENINDFLDETMRGFYIAKKQCEKPTSLC